MHKMKVILLLLICGAVTLAVAQKKPRERERQQNQTASAEQNKQVARRVFDDLFTGGRYNEINQIYDSNCVVHFGNRTERLSQAVDEGKGWRSAAPDLVMTANQITADGDMVNVNWTARGTHTGQGHGLKPTGKHILIHGTSRFRIVNGKIVEAWNSEYRDELFRQLGVPRTTASMLSTGLQLWASVSGFFPDPLYGSLQ
jgi:predicted ester cyclase